MEVVSSNNTPEYMPAKRFVLEYSFDGKDYCSTIEARTFEEAESLVKSHVKVMGELIEEIPA